MSVYKYPTASEQIRSESNTFLDIESFENDKRLVYHVKGGYFPLKTFFDPAKSNQATEILFSANIAKAILIEGLKIASKPVFVIPTILTLLFDLESLIDRYNRLAFKVVSPHILRDWYKMEFITELELLIFYFLLELKIPEEKAERFAEIIGHLIQVDDAYRLRIQDLITSVNSLEPKYIKEYVRLSVERDDHVVSKKFKMLGRLAHIALFVPKLRNAWGKAIKMIDISKLQFKDDDVYWCAYKTGYKFQGLTREEQIQKGKDKGWTYPELKTQ